MDISKLRKKAKEQQAGIKRQIEDNEQKVPDHAQQVHNPEPIADVPESVTVGPLSKGVFEEQKVEIQDKEVSSKSAASHPVTGENRLIEQKKDELKGYSTDVKEKELLCFKLGDEEYAIELGTVKEIIRVKEITPVPNTSDFVLGITVLRGEIIPVVDLRKRIGLPFLNFTLNTRLIMISFEGAMTGLVVDSIPNVKRVAVESIQSAETVGSIDIRFVAGISTSKGGFTVLLKLDEILKQSDILRA
jgi:purine-binding chemotaxis protein CheW